MIAPVGLEEYSVTTRLLSDDIIQQVQDVFNQLQKPVEILFFGSKRDCQYCDDTFHLVTELAGISDKVGLSVYDADVDAEIARQYKVDKFPGLVIAGRDGDQILDYGIRYAGVPSGHEFSSLIHDLILVSGRDSGLGQETRNYLKSLNTPILLQVFVTPTCPYCPRAVVLAHQMALESPMVEAEMVEAMEFPDLSDRFGVSGVPQTTINYGAGTVVGAVPEDHLLSEIRRSLQTA
jgi:glutaredoxin-like protein